MAPLHTKTEPATSIEHPLQCPHLHVNPHLRFDNHETNGPTTRQRSLSKEEWFKMVEEAEYQQRLARQRLARPGYTVTRKPDGNLQLIPEDEATD